MSETQYKRAYSGNSDFNTIDVGGYHIPPDTYSVFDKAFREWEKRRGLAKNENITLRGIALRSAKRAQNAKNSLTKKHHTSKKKS